MSKWAGLVVALCLLWPARSFAQCTTTQRLTIRYSRDCSTAFRFDLERRIFTSDHCRGPARAALRIDLTCGAHEASARLEFARVARPWRPVESLPAVTLEQRQFSANVGSVREMVLGLLDGAPPPPHAPSRSHIRVPQRVSPPPPPPGPGPTPPRPSPTAAPGNRVDGERPPPVCVVDCPLVSPRTDLPIVEPPMPARRGWALRFGAAMGYVVTRNTSALDVVGMGPMVAVGYDRERWGLSFDIDLRRTWAITPPNRLDVLSGWMVDAAITADLRYARRGVEIRAGVGVRGGVVMVTRLSELWARGWFAPLARVSLTGHLSARWAVWICAEAGWVPLETRGTENNITYGIGKDDVWLSPSLGMERRF